MVDKHSHHSHVRESFSYDMSYIYIYNGEVFDGDVLYELVHLVSHMFMHSWVLVLGNFNIQVEIWLIIQVVIMIFQYPVVIRSIGKITPTSKNGTTCIQSHV